MSKSINILEKEYVQWVKSLVERYRQSQIKAAIKVNTVQLFFNLSLGKDIAERQAENVYGSKFYAILSKDLKRELPDVEGLSESNIRYCKRFYLLYKDAIENLPQLWKNYAVCFRVKQPANRYFRIRTRKDISC